MARAVVVGGSGFIGSAVARALQERGWEVMLHRAPRLRTSATSPQQIVEEAYSALDAIHRIPHAEVLINAAGVSSAGSKGSDSLRGANSLLPTMLAIHSQRRDSSRYIHISSTAVQGHTRELDNSFKHQAGTPYAQSKALAEQSLLTLNLDNQVIHRPTSVHGSGRRVTQALQKLARSKGAAVAYPGNRPTPQVHVKQVALAVALISESTAPPQIVVQPNEGFTTSTILELLGGKPPREIHPLVAKSILGSAKACGQLSPYAAAQARRIEMLMFGQRQKPGWLERTYPELCRQHAGWDDLRA